MRFLLLPCGVRLVDILSTSAQQLGRAAQASLPTVAQGVRKAVFIWSLTPSGNDGGAPLLAEVGAQGARALSTAGPGAACPMVRAAERLYDTVTVDDQLEALQRWESC